MKPLKIHLPYAIDLSVGEKCNVIDSKMCGCITQSKGTLVHSPKSMKTWKIETLGNLMTTYIIMHNMIVEDEQHCDVKLSYNRKCTQPLLRGINCHEFDQITIENQGC
jgi:hypothetical protein